MKILNKTLKQIPQKSKFEDIHAHYRPIVKFDPPEILGHEALSLSLNDSPTPSPLFESVKEQSSPIENWGKELLFREKAIKMCQNSDIGTYLFFNVNPNIIHHPDFKKGLTKIFLDKAGLCADKIVFQISEKKAILNHTTFQKIVDSYKNQGYKIAIADAGAGYAGMSTFFETNPHFIKIDAGLTRKIHKDSFKQAIVKSFVQLGQNTNTMILADGIFSEDELRTLFELGVYGGQGPLLQKSKTAFSPLSEETTALLLHCKKRLSSHSAYNSTHHFIGHLAQEIPAIHPDSKGQDLIEPFRKEQHEGICVARNGFVEGIVTKQAFFRTLSSQYGHALYLGRSVTLLMDKAPLTVDFYTPVKKVATLAMSRGKRRIYDTLVVTKESRYYGLVTVKDLLQFAIEMERDQAKEVNPLTGLPGNIIINRVLTDIVSLGSFCFVLYFDLDNFKAYNDVYGFDRGDKVIVQTADIIRDSIKSQESVNSFIGHVGGDDFVCVMETKNKKEMERTLSKILKDFDSHIVSYYKLEDVENGFLIVEDRHGQMRKFDLISLSIAGVYGPMNDFDSSETLACHMAQIKKRVKKIAGSTFELIPTASVPLCTPHALESCTQKDKAL